VTAGARVARELVTAPLVRGRAHRVRWNRSRGLWLLPLVALLALAAAAARHGSHRATPQALAPPPTVAPRPAIVGFRTPVGPRKTSPLAICFVVDDSGSIAEADPYAARAGEISAMLDWLAQWGRPDDVVGVVAHTRRAAVTLPLSAATVAARAPSAGLVGGPPGGGTEFAAAAGAANRVLAAAPPGTRRIALFITDGEAGDVPEAAALLDPSVERYVMGLDGAGRWQASEATWAAAMAPQRTWRIGRIHPGDLAAPLAELLSDLTGQTVGTDPGRA
jgi:hypothetical protein